MNKIEAPIPRHNNQSVSVVVGIARTQTDTAKNGARGSVRDKMRTYDGPASMTRTRTDLSSVSRFATTFPAVPPTVTRGSDEEVSASGRTKGRRKRGDRGCVPPITTKSYSFRSTCVGSSNTLPDALVAARRMRARVASRASSRGDDIFEGADSRSVEEVGTRSCAVCYGPAPCAKLNMGPRDAAITEKLARPWVVPASQHAKTSDCPSISPFSAQSVARRRQQVHAPSDRPGSG